MSGNFGNHTLNFSVPPPNFNPRASSWNNEQNKVGSSRSQSPQCFSRVQSFQNTMNSSNSVPINGKYGYSQEKKEVKEQIRSLSNGERSPMPVPPPPPIPAYIGTPKVSSLYTTQHMYTTTRLPNGLSYQGALTYMPISAETYAQHGYYPRPPPPPIQRNPPLPPSTHSPSRYGPISSQRNFYYNKRKLPSDMDYTKKMNNKKRKKPLSQNIPQRKDWSVEDAKRAIDLEKEYNRRNRSTSLIIKFPDAELNRDIVARFHSSIDTVHFQQPSTPRFCFVTIKDGISSEEVIEKLNKTRFGQGYLSVEHKKDREEDMNIGPEDIDPLTLYVGNLAQDVMKEDMVKIYPKHKRVDIGYAKKMKYTRYAFVSFKNVDDSIEAFRKTHSTQLYSKSLIVRFRRLNGTVGMPGEPKPQLPQKHNDNTRSHDDDYYANNGDERTELSPWDMVDVSQWDRDRSIKQESIDDVTDEEMNEELDEMFDSLPDIAQKIFEEIERRPINKVGLSANSVSNLPINKVEKLPHTSNILSPIPSVHFNDEIKDIDNKKPIIYENQILQNNQDLISSETEQNILQGVEEIEEKPMVDQKPLLPIRTNLSTGSNRSGPIHKPFIELKKEIDKIEVESHALSIDTSLLDVQIKSEVAEPTSVDELSGFSPLSVEKNTETSVEIKKEDVYTDTQIQSELDGPTVSVKSEPIDQDDQLNEDNENPIDEDYDENEFDFGNLLSSLDEKTKKLKKLKEMVL